MPQSLNKVILHMVFSTKNRRPFIDMDIRPRLHAYMAEILRDIEPPQSQAYRVGGVEDHVHLLVEYPPKVSISRLVNSLKGVSSRLLRQRCPEIKERYWKNVLWSPSYFAGPCGGAPLSIAKQYIENQNTPS